MMMWSFALAVAVPVGAGMLVGAVTGGKIKKHPRPVWAPPAAVFAPVWTLLYTMMGVASYLALRRSSGPARAATAVLYVVQLALNLAWTPVFVASPAAGLKVLWAVLAAALLTSVAFARASWVAGALMMPYLAWLGYAAALNADVVVSSSSDSKNNHLGVLDERWQRLHW